MSCLFDCQHQNGLITNEKMVDHSVSFLYSCIICWLSMYKFLLNSIAYSTFCQIQQIYEDKPFYQSFNNSDLRKNIQIESDFCNNFMTEN